MSYLYEVFEHLQLLGMGIWMHIHSVTTADSEENFYKNKFFHIRNKCLYLRYYAMVEAVYPIKLLPHPCHTYEVFEHLQLLCIDIWMHTHTVTTTDVSPDLGELAESLVYARVQTIPLSYR